MGISERDKKVIWHPYTQMQLSEAPVAIIKGEGALLYDEDGNEYIDAISSWWVTLHGHSHPYIADKVAAQLRKLEHVIFAGFTHPGAVELAERLLQKLPDNQQKIFYSDNGSTAVEVALKMAFQYWSNRSTPRTKVVAFRDAYHGDTFGAMSVSGRSAFTAPFLPFLFEVSFIDAPVPGMEEASMQQLRDLITGGGNDIAAFIFEPLVLGAGGMQMYESGCLDRLMKCCREHNILTIADEVMTGFGRTGQFFASLWLREKPDICCMSKGITGGTMALGATSCTEDVYGAFLSEDRLKTLFHGHSFTANPVACAAALASMDLMDREPTWNSIRLIGQMHRDFTILIRHSPAVKNIRQTGTILAIELNPGEETSYFHSLRDFVYSFFLERGIIMRPLGNIIYILPPYCITGQQLLKVYATIESLLDVLTEMK